MKPIRHIFPHINYEGIYTYNHRSRTYIAEVCLPHTVCVARANTLTLLEKALRQALAQSLPAEAYLIDKC